MPQKNLTQQRAALRPSKNVAFFYDDDDDDDVFSMDDSSIAASMDSTQLQADTFALAQFLASTSPDEFAKPSKKQQNNPQFRRASKLISKLRKRSTTATLRSDAASIKSSSASIHSQQSRKKPNHIPLPEYVPSPPPTTEPGHPLQQDRHQKQQQREQEHQRHPSCLRDSGVYSEASDKDVMMHPPPPPVPPPPPPAQQQAGSQQFQDMEFPMPPSVPAKSHARQPRRPAPLPAAVASAAIAAATNEPQQQEKMPSYRTVSTCSSLSEKSVVRSVPSAALKRRSIIRARHAQVQTEDAETQTKQTGACPHCRQVLPQQQPEAEDHRRLSCPPAMASGDLLSEEEKKEKAADAQNLMAMIEQLQKQLLEEQQSRKKLEQQMSRQQQAALKAEQVAQERSRWKGDCLWLQDRIALLPE